MNFAKIDTVPCLVIHVKNGEHFKQLVDEGDQQILTYLELHRKSKGEKSENKNYGFQIKLRRQ